MHLSKIADLRDLSSDSNGCRLIADSFVSLLQSEKDILNPWLCTNQDKDKLALTLYENRNQPLSGLIIGVKDVIATQEFPTKMGAGPNWDNPNMGFDARIVSEARNLGVVIGGKVKSSEFAVHRETDVINPHYKGRTSGTSSSGSAAAVANGSVSIALATQTAGSIARPASYCSVLAMKPSFGDYPRTGILKTTDEFDTVGLFGKSLNHIS
jgi:amidase